MDRIDPLLTRSTYWNIVGEGSWGTAINRFGETEHLFEEAWDFMSSLDNSLATNLGTETIDRLKKYIKKSIKKKKKKKKGKKK